MLLYFHRKTTNFLGGFILFFSTNAALLTVVSPPAEFLLLGWAALFLLCLFSAQEDSPGYPQDHKNIQGYKKEHKTQGCEKRQAVYNLTFKRTKGT